MKRQRHVFASLITLLTCAVLALLIVPQAQAADPTGTWTWSMPGRGDAPARKSTLKLKLDGDKLTGTLSSMAREGAQGRETAIENAQLKGDDISFAVTREFGGNKMTQKFSGKLSGDTIKGKIEFDREGQTRSRDWEAKREK